MCETLRVLNAVRFFRVGLPLSLEQYARLGADGVLSRLLNRHLYALALQVAAYLRLPTHAILTHWARAKVRLGTEDDDEVCRLIVDKLGGRPGISFESVARSAFDEGRIRLATQLLEHEPRAGRQVPLLLGMSGGASESHASPGRQEEPDPSAGATATDEAALDKALDSGDTDLVLYVLHTLRHRLSLAAFLRIASSRPGAAALVEAAPHIFDSDYTSDSGAPPTGGTLLKDLYYADDRRADGARVLIREGLHMPGPRTAADKLALAARLLADAKDGSAAASAAPDMQALREATALLRVQEALARDLGDGSASVPNAPVTAPAGGSDDAATAADEAAGGGTDNDSRGWVGLSVTETIFRLVRLGYYGRAKKLVAEFRVPERVFAWVRLRALVAKRDWREIEELSRASKKSPIGWEPYFTLVLQAGNPRLASTFVPKCQASPGPNGRGPRLEPGEAVRMYERCGMRVKAAEEAVKEKDMDAWTRLLEAAGRGTAEGREIERLGRDVFAKKK